ncbi:MAG: O-antigen ligase family protein [Propionivibrio sp.]|jgi:putative inorganic carbon (HCO3(-)) transporter|nr:O-antigen ligase family protein [Propionivibrio sp.]MBP8275633.1 O-antigen ligase family protein [Propionivibrio sp.]
MAGLYARTYWRISLAGGALVLAFAGILLATFDLSLTWLVLIDGGLAFVALTFLSGRPLAVLFSCYVATVSIELTKGIIAEGGVYTPGLYLSLSDLFLIPMATTQVVLFLLERRRRARFHPLFWAAAAWLAWQWLEVMNSPQTLGATLTAINQTKYFVALWSVAVYLRRPEHWHELFRAVGVAVLLHLTMSLLQFGSGGAIQVQGIKASTQQTLSYAGAGIVELFRPSGLMAHPNALADALALLLPTIIGFLAFVPGLPAAMRGKWAVVLTAALLMLLLTLSRGGWGAFAIGSGVLLLLAYRRGLASVGHVRAALAVAAVGIMATLVVFPTAYLRLTESDNRSTSSRVLLIEQASLIIQRFPLVGVGLGAYTYAAHHNIPTSYSTIAKEFRESLLRGVVHNKYLLVTAETGIVGLLLFLNVFRVALAALLRARFPEDRARQTLAVGLASGVVAAMAAFMLEHANIGATVEIVWVAFGATIALTRTANRPTAGV